MRKCLKQYKNKITKIQQTGMKKHENKNETGHRIKVTGYLGISIGTWRMFHPGDAKKISYSNVFTRTQEERQSSKFLEKIHIDLLN